MMATPLADRFREIHRSDAGDGLRSGQRAGMASDAEPTGLDPGEGAEGEAVAPSGSRTGPRRWGTARPMSHTCLPVRVLGCRSRRRSRPDARTLIIVVCAISMKLNFKCGSRSTETDERLQDGRVRQNTHQRVWRDVPGETPGCKPSTDNRCACACVPALTSTPRPCRGRPGRWRSFASATVPARARPIRTAVRTGDGTFEELWLPIVLKSRSPSK
jgi:hypothetical protein